MPEDREDRLERQRAILRFGVLALLVVTPLPFASVEPAWVLAIEVAAALLGMLAVRVRLLDPEPFPRPARIALAAAGALVALGLLQWIPLPRAWTASPVRTAVESALPEAKTALVPLSVSAPDTLDATLRLAAYAMIGLAAAEAFRSRRHGIQAAAVLAAAGAFQGLYGSAEYLSGHQHIFGYAKKYYVEVATGTFINRNHYADYLAATLPFALALLMDRARAGAGSRSLRERIVRLAEPESLRTILGAAAAGAIWLGVVLSYSRGGLAAALAATAVFTLLSRSKKRAALVLALVLAIPTGFLLFQDVRAPGERFLEAQEGELATLNTRLPVWKGALHLLPRHPILGTGLGTFEAAFATVLPTGVSEGWDHAHNDWLQGLVEGGLVGAIAIVALAAAAGAAALRSARASPLARALPAALAAIAVACAVDFPARMPAVACLVAVVGGIAVGPAASRSTAAFPERP